MGEEFIYDTCESSQLTLQVANILRKLFSPDKTLLVSSSENDSRPVNTTLKNLHHTARCNIHVFLPSSLKLKPTYQQEEKTESYVIFNGDSDDLTRQVGGLVNTTS
jgi:hypothetical protein